jgi:DNA-binding GntR family transcriptional regulator
MHASKSASSGNLIAYEAIKKLIIEGDLPAGQPIRQVEIANQLGLSKIPVREALIRLESEGLIKLTPNVGATVIVHTLADYLEMLYIRQALECKALELAIPNMVQKDFDHAQQILSLYAQATTQHQRSDYNLAFHQSLYAPCMQPQLLKMIEQVQNQMGHMLRHKISQLAGHARSLKEHQDILTACQKGEVNKASQILSRHLEATQKELRAYFRYAD